jgi:hypothetical protein
MTVARVLLAGDAVLARSTRPSIKTMKHIFAIIAVKNYSPYL